MLDWLLTRHPLELSAFATALLVVGITIWTLRDALTDHTFLVAKKFDGPRRVVADMNVRQEQFKLAMAGIVAFGTGAGLALPPPPPPLTIVPQALIFTLGWLIVGALMACSSILDKSARHRLQRLAPVELEQTVGQVPPLGRPPAPAAVEHAEAVREQGGTYGRRSTDHFRRATDHPPAESGAG